MFDRLINIDKDKIALLVDKIVDFLMKLNKEWYAFLIILNNIF